MNDNYITCEALISKLKDDINIYGYVYIVTNINNGKIYIGQSSRLDKRSIYNYYGSGRIIRYIDKKILQKHIICVAYDLYELSHLEEYHINEKHSYDLSIGYNISRTTSYFHPENIKGQKIQDQRRICQKKKEKKRVRKQQSQIKNVVILQAIIIHYLRKNMALIRLLKRIKNHMQLLKKEEPIK